MKCQPNYNFSKTQDTGKLHSNLPILIGIVLLTPARNPVPPYHWHLEN